MVIVTKDYLYFLKKLSILKIVLIVCGSTSCSITSTKTNCGTASADCISAFYTGSYTFLQADSNGQPIYYKAATLNGIPLNYFLYLFFVPEINVWTVGDTK